MFIVVSVKERKLSGYANTQMRGQSYRDLPPVYKCTQKRRSHTYNAMTTAPVNKHLMS